MLNCARVTFLFPPLHLAPDTLRLSQIYTPSSILPKSHVCISLLEHLPHQVVLVVFLSFYMLRM